MKSKILAVFLLLGLASIPGRAEDAPAQSVITLLAKDAKLQGGVVYYEKTKNLGKWNGIGSSATWSLKDVAPGAYEVQIVYALKGDPAGRMFTISSGAEMVTVTSLNSAKGWFDFQTEKIGTIHLAAKETNFTITAEAIPLQRSLMNLSSVTLRKKKVPVFPPQ